MTLKRQRILIFVVAYNAEKTIQQVLRRIPHTLSETYDVEVLVIDDASRDSTFESSHVVKRDFCFPFPLHILFNPVNQGYGGNQKIGYQFAIQEGFDFVALVHGDGQYAPECLPDLLEPLREGRADAVFGSRMIDRGAALKGGMPLYKYLGNRILTSVQNWLLGTHFCEFHSGYRIYSLAALKTIPFHLNTNDFHFDTEIIIQFVLSGLKIIELPIPTYYGDEICYVNGLRYAKNVVRAALSARVQKLGIFYDRRFDVGRLADNSHYELKRAGDSTHTATLSRIKPGSRVLDLGCAGGYLATEIKARLGCHVTGCDLFALPASVAMDKFIQQDLNDGLPPVRLEEFDYVLMLDVIEHLSSPERFVDRLQDAMGTALKTELIVTTGNIAFIITRLMLLCGQFNYGKRGILDLTHTRLFTFASIRALLEQGGFDIVEVRGIPVPFALLLGDGLPARTLAAINRAFIRLAKGLFSYQIMVVAKPRPSLDHLLSNALYYASQRSLSWNKDQERVSPNDDIQIKT